MYSASFTDILFIPLPCRQHHPFHMLYGYGTHFPIGGGNVCIMGLHAIWLLHFAIPCWFDNILVLHVYISFSNWNFACILIYCHSKLTLWIQEHCMQTSALFIGDQQGWAEFYSQHDHPIALHKRGSRTWTILQTWCAYMDSTSCITFSTNFAYISFNNCQYLYVIPHFSFGGKTWGKIT